MAYADQRDTGNFRDNQGCGFAGYFVPVERPLR
jgi:hypothetical protein